MWRGVLQVLLHVDGRIAESRLGFLARHRHGVEKCRFGVDNAHAASAATARCLDDHRVADRSRCPHDLAGFFRERARRSWHRRDGSGRHRLLGRDLVPHQADRIRPRTDEDESALLDALSEIGVFRQKAVAWMDRFRIGHFGRTDDRRDVEIALARGRPDRYIPIRRRASRTWRRCRPPSARPRFGRPALGMRAGCAARSLPGWRSRSS